MLGPEAADHLLVQDEVRVEVEGVVGMVGEYGGFVDGVWGAEGGCYLGD